MKDGFKGYGSSIDALRGRKAGAKSIEKPPHAKDAKRGFASSEGLMSGGQHWPGQSNALPKK